jgi:CHAT domain-containing protein
MIMRHSFFRRMQWFLLAGLLMGLGGCANMMETMPTPPAFSVSVKLNGPYDADIPTREANQIKSASLMLDWAVPYIFIRVASHFESVGDEGRSIHFFNRAIDEFRKRNNLLGEGSAVSRKISALIRFGNLQTACLTLKELGEKSSNAPFKAFVFYNYGYYHLKNGDYAEAREYFAQALAANLNYSADPDLMALKRDTELMYGVTLILADYFPAVSSRLGLADFDEEFYRDIRRNISEGLSHLEQVPALNNNIVNTKIHLYFPEIVPSSMECDVHNLLGLAYGIAGKTPDAVKNLETAGNLARKTDYHLGEADSIFFLNQVYLLNKNRSEGIQAVRVLAEIADRYQLASYSIWANMILAHYNKGVGDIDRTMDAMNKALRLMEENISWLSHDADFRGIGLFQRQAIYEALLDLCAGKSDEKGAFKTAERSKAAVLADGLSEDVIGKTPAVLEDIEQMRFYRKRLAQYYRRLLSPVSGSAIFMDTVEKINKTRRTYVEKLFGIKEQDEALYSLLGVVPPELGDLQRQLDNDTTLFSYYISTRYLYVWVISKNGFHQERIRMSRNDVNQLVNDYLSALASRDKKQADAWAEKVYDIFLKPVIPFVYGDRVGFVPHGTLYDLPFASMRYVKSYLVDGFTIFYLPHTGMLKPLLTKKPTPGAAKAIIFANPQGVENKPSVVRAGEELDMLKRTFPRADYFVKDNSSEDDLQKLTGSYDIIHFVPNGYPTGEAPLDSCFLLTATKQRHGCLSVRDIFRLQLSSLATVLSACSAERGLSSNGAGISLLTSAWLYAVSPQVLTQLWEVEDKSRTALIRLFYKNLEKSDSAADALRAAQNGMIQMGYGPSDWAAFILTSRY